MPKIIVKRAFSHCVGEDVHPTKFKANKEPIEVDDRTAEVALQNGWATKPKKAPAKPKKDAPTEAPTDEPTDEPTGEPTGSPTGSPEGGNS